MSRNVIKECVRCESYIARNGELITDKEEITECVKDVVDGISRIVRVLCEKCSREHIIKHTNTDERS